MGQRCLQTVTCKKRRFFAQSKKATCPSGGILFVYAIEDEIYERYESFNNVTTEAEWRSIVAMAFATIKEKGYAVKVGKTRYRPVEDVHTPPIKRYSNDRRMWQWHRPLVRGIRAL